MHTNLNSVTSNPCKMRTGHCVTAYSNGASLIDNKLFTYFNTKAIKPPHKHHMNMFELGLNSCSPLLAGVITAIIIILTVIMFRFFSKKQVSDLGKKYVLITGCDSGFGRETAVRLDKMGVCVLATCLTKEGEQSLKSVASNRLKTFQLDVTNSQQIKDLYEQVKGLLPSGHGMFAMQKM